MAGTLYLVATPIGNLEDITHRALRILREVDLIACEDTRQTRKLLGHYGIRRPVISYHEHNEKQRAEEFAERLREGISIALVSDAGMPLVSDPGYRLVAKAVEAGIAVHPVPGPSAVLTALAASGLPTDSFYFGGFLPAKRTQRRRTLESLRQGQATLVFYETPRRIVETLADVEEILGARPVVVAREMTKVHEEFLRGTAGEVRAALEDRVAVKGEITLLVGRGEAPPAGAQPLATEVEACLRQGVPRMEAIKTVAKRRGLSKREVYQALVSG